MKKLDIEHIKMIVNDISFLAFWQYWETNIQYSLIHFSTLGRPHFDFSNDHIHHHIWYQGIT